MGKNNEIEVTEKKKFWTSERKEALKQGAKILGLTVFTAVITGVATYGTNKVMTSLDNRISSGKK